MSKAAPGTGSIRELGPKKKEVFKPLLENPFANGADWPPVMREVSEKLMECLAQVLSGYGSYLEMKKSDKENSLPVHELDSKLTVGFNSTVQKLEKQAEPNRAKVLGKLFDISKRKYSGYVKYVFVAKSDISTQLLTSFFPILTFSASKSSSDRVKLVELPKGASAKISSILRKENVYVFSMEEDWLEGKLLFDIINAEIKDVDVPWLAGIYGEPGVSSPPFKLPNIKFVKTTMPLWKCGASKKGGIMKKKKNRKNGDGVKQIEKRS